MSQVFKIRETIRGLCSGCSNAQVIQFESGATKIHCYQLDKQLPGPVYKCSSYRPADKPDKHELEKIATILYTDPYQKTVVGFARPGTEMHRKLRGSSTLDD